MKMAASSLGPGFERTAVSIERGRRVRVGAVLKPAGPHRQCQIFEIPQGGDRRGVMRVRVRGTAMSAEGVRDGDYLVLDPRAEALGPGRTVLADVDGCAVLRRVARSRSGGILLEPAERNVLPFSRERTGRVHGALVGILRKRGFERAVSTPPALAPSTELGLPPGREAPAGDPPRLRALQHCLRSVRSTYSTTRHPRLRRALRDEADLLRREIDRERARTLH